MPSYQLTINGRLVYGGEEILSLSMAIIKLAPPAESPGVYSIAGGTYMAGTVVTLVALPRNPGYEPIWKGVDTHSGYNATVRMDGDKAVEFLIGARIPTPTPAPTPTRGVVIVGPPPTAVPTATPAPTPTPTPQPPGEPTHTPTPTPTVTPVPGGGLIAFETNRDGSGNEEIYVMASDGSNQTNLTQFPGASDAFPAWSPDGTKIALQTFSRDGNDEVYVMNADGSNQTNLSNNPAADIIPDWSSDGTKIAFSSNRDGNFEIYVMNADGSNQVRFTTNPDEEDVNLNWCTTGDKIVFTSQVPGSENTDVYVMDAVDNDGDGNGDNLILLANNAAHDNQPHWSPDYSKIAFVSQRDDGVGEIYVMDAVDSDGDGNGDNLIRFTTNPAADQSPAWSPDQNRIAFYSARDGNFEIYVMDAVDNDGDGNGDNLIRLTNNSAHDIHPDWQP